MSEKLTDSIIKALVRFFRAEWSGALITGLDKKNKEVNEYI